MNLKQRGLVAAGSIVAAIGILPVAGASAAPPEFPHGIGVCMSQVAIQPDLAGADNLGQLVREAAGGGRSGVPVLVEDFRGDGPGGCGAPPGPGHLG